MNSIRLIRRLPKIQSNVWLPSSCILREHSSKKCEVKDKCVKYECRQAEPYLQCKSFVECGPCSKHKYMDITCKVAIITGGACGIGFSTANELLCQEAYRVIIADRNKKNGIKAKEMLENVHGKNRVCFVQVDVNNEDQFKRAFKTGYDKFGGIDILINNASTIADLKWDYAVDTNLKGILRGTLLGFEWLQKEKKTMKGGVIVNIASVTGLQADPNAPLLSAVKHGVVGLSRAMGDTYFFNKTGVRVVGLCPGKTKTSEPENSKEISKDLKQAYFDEKISSQHPDKVAKAVSYVIRYAPGGSIWIAENAQLYKAIIPDRKIFSKAVDVV